MVPASPSFIAIFYESNTEGTNFRIVFYVYVMCMFCKSPEVTLCSLRGYNPSINKQTILLAIVSLKMQLWAAYSGVYIDLLWKKQTSHNPFFYVS